MAINFQEFLQSDGGGALLSGLLSGLGNYGQARAQEKMSREQIAAEQAMQQQRLGVDDMWRRDQAMLGAAPTGWAQNYQQQTLMKDLMLQKLMNGGGMTPTNEAVAAKLQATAPKQLQISPEWAGMNPFGVDQTMNSIQQRQGVLDMLSQGRGPQFDFMNSGYQNLNPERANQLQQQSRQYGQFAAQQNPLQSALSMPNQPTQQSQPGGSRLGNAAKGAMTGASVGSVVPGIGTAIGAGIGGLIGLFRGGNGGGTPPTSGKFGALGGAQQPIQSPASRLQNPYLR